MLVTLCVCVKISDLSSKQIPSICYNIVNCYHCAVCYQFSSVTQLCPTLCDPMNHSTPGLPVHHQLPESSQTHVHRGSHFFFFDLDYASHVTLDTVWLIFLEHTSLSYTFSLVWEMIMLLIYLWKWLYGMDIGKSFLELHSHASLTLALLETCLVIGFISFSMDSWSLYFCQREQLQCLIPGFTLPFLQ